MPTAPTPRTWTLRFKHHRSTILLHIDPIQTLPSIRRDLLAALTQTNPTGTFNTHTLPQNPDEILLAKPVDINDLSLGWETLASTSTTDSETSGKGKGKASSTASSVTKGKNSLQDCPQGAGLRDGGVVAFKFKGQGGDEGGVRDTQEEDEDEIVVAEEDRGPRRELWDVVVPTLEETYGDQMDEEEDEGVGMDEPTGR
ncbi:hypothetical protein LTR09_006054 [Extremus antarcticus]|uniref:Uncharacterized protein n=1 Tax=Extremus antarcticus TaxID=702011 RepID=A0AAJ0GBZ1_9PEZI|nr:hypothetical protein LTR09_006054 [Extremus antarcticus]